MTQDVETFHYLGYYALLVSQRTLKSDNEDIEFLILHSPLPLREINPLLSSTSSQFHILMPYSPRRLAMTQDLEVSYYLGYYAYLVSQPTLKSDNEDLEFLILRSRLALGQIDSVLLSTSSESNPTRKGINLLGKSLKTSSSSEIEAILAHRDEKLHKTSENYGICLSSN
jgi:hypothetical protein